MIATAAPSHVTQLLLRALRRRGVLPSVAALRAGVRGGLHGVLLVVRRGMVCTGGSRPWVRLANSRSSRAVVRRLMSPDAPLTRDWTLLAVLPSVMVVVLVFDGGNDGEVFMTRSMDIHD